MRKFETDVQLVRYEVLKEVSKFALEGTLEKKYKSIPKILNPGPKARFRCCVYKEREITKKRVKLAMGGDKSNPNVVEVIGAACDECPINRFTVTEACRGCMAHRCSEACPVGAIYHVGQRAYINQQKCIECGKCKAACQYDAISDVMRPCRRSCPVDALSIDEDKKAVIDNEKCIQCGACLYQCPFGAIMDKSQLVDVINELKSAQQNEDKHVYAVVAPAISSQFTKVKIGQVIQAIRDIGFYDVIEAALGADLIAYKETLEFAEEIEEKGCITSSCCPAFVSLIQKKYPELVDKVSTLVSPMIAVSRLIKSTDEKAKIVFIGPCVAKKMEIKQAGLEGSTDYAISFEELCALFDAKDIDVSSCNDYELNNASLFGRIFARTGGLSEAIRHVKEQYDIKVDFKPVSCDGIVECEKALKLAKVKRLDGNFIEGMVCVDGCIGGPLSLHHGPKDKKEVDKYGQLAIEKCIKDSLRALDIDKLHLSRK
ncbi:MAG: ferredoxin [Clostridiales bacterium GWB2_37_7]|nr:MAG: ferredoxin [Clostridiales bacterium GWB2_37_7]